MNKLSADGLQIPKEPFVSTVPAKVTFTFSPGLSGQIIVVWFTPATIFPGPSVKTPPELVQVRFVVVGNVAVWSQPEWPFSVAKVVGLEFTTTMIVKHSLLEAAVVEQTLGPDQVTVLDVPGIAPTLWTVPLI